MSERTPQPSPAPVPPGWYPDPEDPRQQRYWSGQSWTEHRAPVVGASGPEPTQPLPVTAPVNPLGGPPSSSNGPGESGQWWRKPWVLVAGGVVVGAILISLTAGDADPTVPAAAEPVPTVTATVTATATATKEIEVEKTVTATPQPKAKPKPAPAPAEGVGSGKDSFVVPSEIGKNLQIAQDDLQEASGDPFFVSFSEDATGADRFQMIDSGWMVCSQEPSAGTRIGLYDEVTLYVVRVSETCP